MTPHEGGGRVVQASVIQFIQQGSPEQTRRLLYLVGISGLANIALIVLINAAAAQVALVGVASTKLQMLYAIGFALFVVSYKASLTLANQVLQTQLENLRERIVNRIRLAPLRSIERLGAGELHGALARGADQLSQNFSTLVGAAQGGLLLIFCIVYIGAISFSAAVIVALATAGALWIFFKRRLRLMESLAGIYEQEATMLDSLTHFSAGFQELRVNRQKSDSLFRRFTSIVDELEVRVRGVGGQWTGLMMFGNAYLYSLLGIVVFVLPMFFHGYPQEIYKIAATAIFAVGPVTAIIMATPIYFNANAELERMYALERKVNDATAPEDTGNLTARFADFETIRTEGLTYAYRDTGIEDPFTLGPIDVEIKRGQIVFFCGANGGGKSTLIKLLVGLYAPDAGLLRVDSRAVGHRNLADYRSLFAAIFPDLHLFPALHGIDTVDEANAQSLLERMHLQDKVRIVNHGFSTTELSTGQRKRLAMIAALLEDKPVYVFDEWAADQDVHFRHVFYHEILPQLKQQGKTVLAVTHDERYWDACDVRYRLDLGRLTLEKGAEG